jgi:hypothetical protein
VRIAILGALEVQSGGRRVELSGARLQSLLARGGAGGRCGLYSERRKSSSGPLT